MAGNFKDAFAAARKAGKAKFTWNGKSYHTKTKEEVANAGPKARPKAPAKGEASAPPRASTKGPMARPRRSAAGTPTSGYNARTMKPGAGRTAAASRNQLSKAAGQAEARRRLMEKGFAKGGMAKKGC